MKKKTPLISLLSLLQLIKRQRLILSHEAHARVGDRGSLASGILPSQPNNLKTI